MGQRVLVPRGGGAGPSLTMAPPVPGQSPAKPNPPTQILKGHRAGADAATLTWTNFHMCLNNWEREILGLKIPRQENWNEFLILVMTQVCQEKFPMDM